MLKCYPLFAMRTFWMDLFPSMRFTNSSTTSRLRVELASRTTSTSSMVEVSSLEVDLLLPKNPSLAEKALPFRPAAA